MHRLAEALSQLQVDPERPTLGTSPELEAAQKALFEASDDDERAKTLSAWLAKYQPCLFGKIAARNEMIEYCFIREEDIAEGDVAVRNRIASARLRWWTAALSGKKSGFVVHCCSERVALACPDQALLQFAQRLAALYLRVETVEPDQIYLDQAFLELPGTPLSRLFRWDAGVNVFATAGDRRWWQDHRIPGGLAFSVNSVGHMVKSAEMRKAVGRFNEELGIAAEADDTGNVDSLGKALELAMSTIANASNGPSGRATWLLPADQFGLDEGPACPIQLGKKLDGMWHCSYRGLYHTDVTLPTAYFRTNVLIPDGLNSLLLDFTYLFDRSLDNPAYESMGTGQQFRTSGVVESSHGDGLPGSSKSARVFGVEIDMQQYVELAADLQPDERRNNNL